MLAEPEVTVFGQKGGTGEDDASKPVLFMVSIKGVAFVFNIGGHTHYILGGRPL